MKMKVSVAVLVLGLMFFSDADPILNIDNGIYYEEILQAGTWDEAKAYAETLSYNGIIGRLAIVDSDDTRQFLVNNVLGGAWHIEWIGAYQSDSTLYNVDGTDFNTAALSDNFDSGDPASGDYGVALKGSSYGGNLASFEPSDSGVGAFVVEYAVVPEPATAGLLAGAGLVIALYRRFFSRV